MFILVHGSNHSSRCWDPILDHLEAPTLAIDLPGRGRHPAPLDRINLSDFIRSAVQDIEDADAADRVIQHLAVELLAAEARAAVLAIERVDNAGREVGCVVQRAAPRHDGPGHREDVP